MHHCQLESNTLVDYLEEQQNELEALQSIYPEEFQGTETKWDQSTCDKATWPSRILNNVPIQRLATTNSLLPSILTTWNWRIHVCTMHASVSQCTDDFMVGSLSLRVKYTPQYPDELPEFDIDVLEGKLSSDQKKQIMDALKASVSVCIHPITLLYVDHVI